MSLKHIDKVSKECLHLLTKATKCRIVLQFLGGNILVLFFRDGCAKLCKVSLKNFVYLPYHQQPHSPLHVSFCPSSSKVTWYHQQSFYKMRTWRPIAPYHCNPTRHEYANQISLACKHTSRHKSRLDRLLWYHDHQDAK